MIHLEALSRPQRVDDYPAWFISNLIDPQYHLSLATRFPPRQAFERLAHAPLRLGHGDVGSDVSLRFLKLSRRDIRKHPDDYGFFHPDWVELLSELATEDYFDRVSRIAQVDLADTELRVEFIILGNNDFLSAHDDRQKRKVLVQIFYPNTLWHTDWGGYFELLDTDSTRIGSVPPMIDRSVLLLPSREARHRVSRVSPAAAQVRKSFQLEWYVPA